MRNQSISCLLLFMLAFAVPVASAQDEPVAPVTAPAAESAAEAAPSEPSSVVINALAEHTSGIVEEYTGKWGRIKLIGIEAWRLVACLILIFLTFVTASLVKLFLAKYAARLAARTKWKGDDLLFECARRPASLFIVAVGLYLAALPLLSVLNPTMTVFFGRVCAATAASAVLWYVYQIVALIDGYLRKFVKSTRDDLDDTLIHIIRKTLRVFIVVIGVLFIGQNILKLDITTLLASAGVLGLALAFAAQDTIANLFGTLMLLLDRPFRVGDRVVLEGADGPVESIGIRSTRVRTLAGDLVSVPNKKVANTKVQNIGRRPHIKRVSNIGIPYNTPVEKVERAVEIVRDVLADHEGMDPEFPPRVFFSEFNDSSLNIVMFAWYHPPEYWEYLQWCENVNLAIMRAFEREGVEFAFPTTTTYLAQGKDDSIKVLSEPAGLLEEQIGTLK